MPTSRTITRPRNWGAMIASAGSNAHSIPVLEEKRESGKGPHD